MRYDLRVVNVNWILLSITYNTYIIIEFSRKLTVIELILTEPDVYPIRLLYLYIVTLQPPVPHIFESSFFNITLYLILNMVKIKCDINFEKIWLPFCQIWIIFTYLRLWIASARHNFKWVKIQIK